MAIQTINLGTYANDGTGDDLRVAFQKVNANFAEIDNLSINNAINLGAGTGIFAGKQSSPLLGDNLKFKSLVAGSNVFLTANDNEIIISSQFVTLTQNLNLNNNTVEGTGNISITGNITASGGNVTVGNNLTVNGQSNLGPVGRVKIFGGATGQVLTTLGNGELTWSSTGSEVDWDFGNVGVGSEITPGGASTPIQYFLMAIGVDMGTIASPNSVTINLGGL